MSLGGLAAINIELTSFCDRHTLCAWCGHQNARVSPELRRGEIDLAFLETIRDQIPWGVRVAFHRDGDPVAYSRLGEVLRLFAGYFTTLVTHGETLAGKAQEIVGQCSSVTVSVFEKDLDRDLQLTALRQFLAIRGSRPPLLAVKIVGAMRADFMADYVGLGVPILHRSLHALQGDFRYRESQPPIPEELVCLDLLSHPSIDWQGDLYLCNRLQPEQQGRLGNLRTATLEELWNGAERVDVLAAHRDMRRQDVPACRGCEYWGYPAA